LGSGEQTRAAVRAAPGAAPPAAAMRLVKDSRGFHLLHEDIQSKLKELLGSPDEEVGEEEDALARFLVLLLSKGVDRATIEGEVGDVMPEDLGPEFVSW
jgi:hypothetical protein